MNHHTTGLRTSKTELPASCALDHQNSIEAVRNKGNGWRCPYFDWILLAEELEMAATTAKPEEEGKTSTTLVFFFALRLEVFNFFNAFSC